MSSGDRGKDVMGGESSSRSMRSSGGAAGEHIRPPPPPLSRYESQKRRDWNTFSQYLKNKRPPVSLPQCNGNHVLDFLQYLDQFGKTRVHSQGCAYFGLPEPPAPCTCPLKQAWGSLDALIGRLRAAYEENGGSSETNPFGRGSIRVYLREVRESQAKARGISYKKNKKRRRKKKNETDIDTTGGASTANDEGTGGAPSVTQTSS